MRVRLNRNQPNAKQKAVLKEECKKEFFNLLESYNREVCLQIMHILHFDYGYGEKRLKEFFKKLKAMQERHIQRYEVNDDDVPDICEIKLKESGIDIDKILNME